MINFNEIANKYHQGWATKLRNANTIEEIVIHGTGGGSSAMALLQWMLNPGVIQEHNYNNGIGLFHYLNDFNGDMFQILPVEYWCYHSTSGNHAMKEIGIENMNSSPTNQNEYTVEQYKSLMELIFNMLEIYPSITRITSHKYNINHYNDVETAKKYNKECPGNFNWDLLTYDLNMMGYQFKTDGDLIYDIRKG